MVGTRALSLFAVAGGVVAQSTTYQAENATLNGVTVGTSVTGFTGTLEGAKIVEVQELIKCVQAPATSRALIQPQTPSRSTSRAPNPSYTT